MYVESSKRWYYGDHVTKMTFHFDGNEFSYVKSYNIVDPYYCKQCVIVAVESWVELQVRVHYNKISANDGMVPRGQTVSSRAIRIYYYRPMCYVYRT